MRILELEGHTQGQALSVRRQFTFRVDEFTPCFLMTSIVIDGRRPLFLYGTLTALPLLAWAITGDSSKTNEAASLLQPAKLTGFARYSLHGCDYPAIVRSDNPDDVVEGFLFRPQTTSQRRKLDDFEGESYRVVPVKPSTPEELSVDADVYLWDGDTEQVMSSPWDFDYFVRERLETWLELFGGMELVGEEVPDEKLQ